MKKIYDANENIIQILGTPKYDASKTYRPLHFIVVEDADDDGLVIYNNMTKAACELNKEEKIAFENLDFENKVVQYLLKEWYIVPKDFNELKVFDQVRDLYSTIFKGAHSDNAINSFVILPTTDCNARCFYCYEIGCKRMTMDKKMAQDVAKFIMESSNSKEVSLRWFGGEPLLGREAMDEICKILYANDYKISSSIISNGYLFDEDLVKHARDYWKISNIQITLDGTEEKYNAAKAYAQVDENDERSPFYRVLDNIELLVKNGIQVVIRLNLSPENEGDIEELIDQLSSRFEEIKDNKDSKGRKMLNVYTHTLFQELMKTGAKRARSDKSLKDCYDRELKLERALHDKGLMATNLLPRYIRYNNCMADHGCNAVVMPDGALGSCEHFTEVYCSWGNIYSKDYDMEIIKDWQQKYPPLDKCYDCPSYPNCMRLKNCPNVLENCEDEERAWKIQKLHDQLLNTYTHWKSLKK